ncbi:hypothetical protein GB937_009371 [Aspergillus fischeri]|nr:hypothetical protein GB937_009371 [Aspergillus fischeri]
MSPSRDASWQPTSESSLWGTDKDDLKQLFVNAIRQVLSKMPVAPAFSSKKSQPTTTSLLTDLLEAFQATPSSAATTGHSTSVSVVVEKDNHLHLPCDSQGMTPPNSPCITPSEPAAVFQLKEPTDLLIHAADDPRAYSVSAEKLRPTASDCRVSGNSKSSMTLNKDMQDQDLGPAKCGQLTPNTVDTAATGGQRLVAGARVSNVEERKAPRVCDIKKSQPQLNADELEKLLANVADTRGQADSSNTADALGFYEACEIGIK